MRIYLVILILFSFSAFGQKARFKEIRLFANPKYFSPKEKYASIIYPLIETNDKSADKRINDRIKLEALSLEENANVKSELKNQIAEGLTDISYEVTFNRDNILSLNISFENCGGAHISYFTNYFNFNLRTGAQIVLSDLIKQDIVDSFRHKVFLDRKDSINHYKVDLQRQIKQATIDTSVYQWITEMLDEENIMQENFGETFSLSHHGIEIIEPVEFPSAIRSQEPDFHLIYSVVRIKEFMNPGYLKLLQN